MLVFAVIDVYIAYSFFRLNVKGWWVALASLGLRIISTAITYARADLFDAYRRLGWSPAQVDMLRNNPAFQAGRFLWISLLFTVLYAGFLIWTKRYFPQVGPADASFLDASQTPTQQSGS